MDIRELWRPNCLNIWWRKSLATPAVSMVFEQGMRITPFIRLWLTTTINKSCPFEGGRSIIRLMESCLKGKGKEDGMGARGG